MTQSAGPGAPLKFGEKKKDAYIDLLRPGDGTPWENRGEHGAPSAFFRTALRVMFKPGLLFDHIRGTNQSDDVRSFAWTCSIMWGLSMLVHRVLFYFIWYTDTAKYDVAVDQYITETIILSLVAGVWPYLMLLTASSLYHMMIATEMKGPVPRHLTFNLIAYSMGPSILAVVPFAGPPLALIWILFAMIAAGRKRLYVAWGAAIIDALVSFAAAVALSVAVFYIGGYILRFAFEAPVQPKKAPIRRTF